MEPNDIDYTALSSRQLEDLRDGAQAELRRRVHHYAGDGCVVHEGGETFATEAGRATDAGELTEGDEYLNDGRWWRIDDIQPVETTTGVTYHVTRTPADD